MAQMEVLRDFEVDEGVELRLLNDEDSRDLYKLLEKNREHLGKWVPVPEAIGAEKGIQDFIKNGFRQYLNFQGVHLGLRHKKQLVGVVTIHHIDWANRSLGLGYWIDKGHEGMGLVTRACRILVDFAFRDLKMHRVEISCAPENQKSRALAERLGFRMEGSVRDAEWVNSRFVDHVIYGMLETEWKFK